MKVIKILVDKNAKIKIDADGFRGNECTKYTHKLLSKLSGRITSEIKKPAFYETETEKELA